jgi:dihydropteroate synthase
MPPGNRDRARSREEFDPKAIEAPTIMGILNVTPDSFSDGGSFFEHDFAIAHGLALARDGATIVDVGGESTRPGATPVAETEELRRVVPVIEGLRAAGLEAAISIDTSKVGVARAALDAGATIVNDVTALRGRLLSDAHARPAADDAA